LSPATPSSSSFLKLSTLRHRDVVVDGLHQIEDRLLPLLVAFERLQARPAHDRDLIAREAVAREQLAHFQFDQFEQLRIVDRVDLVEPNDQVRHADLTGQQDVLARLRHRAVRRRDDKDAAVHLRRAGDHVLHVVGVTRAVHVRVVAILRLVFDVRRRDRDTALALFRRVVDRIERAELHLRVEPRQHLRNRRRRRRLTVVDVTDGANVDVRFRPIEFFLRHARLDLLTL
jgi:hypothetical protein